MLAHHDWLPTILAMAGDTEVTGKLLKGYAIGDMTYKVHPDGYNLRLDPYERADITSNTYYDWLLDHAFLLVPAQDYVGKFLMTFKDFPQRQKAASFNLDEVLKKLTESGGGQ